MPLKIDAALPASAGSEAIPYIWARSRVADHMRDLMVPDKLRRSGLSNNQLEGKVTELGLANAIVTQWTSFVAVSQQVVNPDPGSAVAADVPLPMVKGVGPAPIRRASRAAGLPAGSAKPPTCSQLTCRHLGQKSVTHFSGGSTPEPEQIFGVLLLILTVGGALLRKSSRNNA